MALNIERRAAEEEEAKLVKQGLPDDEVSSDFSCARMMTYCTEVFVFFCKPSPARNCEFALLIAPCGSGAVSKWVNV